MLRVGFYQFRPEFGQVRKNVLKVVGALETVSADIIVLPELPFTGYYFKDREELFGLAEEVHNSPHISLLHRLCKERDFYLVTGFAEKYKEKLFNSAVLIGPEGVLHTYRKLHLFNEEKNWFDAGDISLQINEVRGARLGLMVCFDWIFPEVVRVLALQGANIICHPSNLVLSYCQHTMISRCIENGIFAITANRYGADNRPQGSLKFTGKSQIVAPKGELIYRAPTQKETVQVREIDIDLADDKYITKRNHIFGDRRTDFYRSLTEK